ncbi:MAG TPA: hypothetical protein VNX17_10985 [Edaphobacter sp.]|nr:hypothetical protein [Edaphobacter sp.]
MRLVNHERGLGTNKLATGAASYFQLVAEGLHQRFQFRPSEVSGMGLETF